MGKLKFAAAFLCVLAFASSAQAKKDKPAQNDQQQSNQAEEPAPRYTPFPHNQIFNVTDLNGKTPGREMWIRIDSTGRANGSSGCKNFSGVFIIGQERLGPRAMPAFTEVKCEPAELAVEREFWSILLTGPYWDVKGDELIIKGFKGGIIHLQRAL
jgi:heat shock protein HslJ